MNLARKYAQAILDVADSVGQDIVSELEVLVPVLAEDEVVLWFDSPVVSKAIKQESLGALESHLSLEGFSFLRILVDYKRLRLLPVIVQLVRQKQDEMQHILRGSLTVAHPLGQEEKKRLEGCLEQLWSKKVILEESCDRNILGGFQVQAEGFFLDGSLLSQLECLSKTLREASLKE